jgi:hypothetical protein
MRPRIWRLPETACAPQRRFTARAFGIVDVRVVHDPHREAGRDNVPTVLQRGRRSAPLMKATDHHGRLVAIERRSDGSYTLSIS